MDETAILAVLREIVGDMLGRPEIVLAREDTASDHEGWDSVRQVAIILAVEQRFRVRFRSREMDRLRSVGDFVDLISARGGIKEGVLF